MLYLLPSPIGNLADITLRTLQILQKCDVFLCEDTRVTRKLFSLLEQNGTLLKKERSFLSFHSHNQSLFLQNLNPSFFDVDVAFMSDAGMPCVSDPGSLLVEYAQKNRIPYEVLPGPSALTLAYAYSGFGDGGFVFDGFLPSKSLERQERLAYWREILGDTQALIVFESPYRLIESLEDLCRIDAQCNVFMIKEMTKKFEMHYKGGVTEVLELLKDKQILGEWVFVLKFSSKTKENKLGKVEILHMDLPPKIKAKLLSKITADSAKNWYQKIIEGKE